MADFADFDNAVKEFFNDFGFTATYIKASTDGSYDTSTGEYAAVVEEIPVEAILLDLTLQSNGLSAKFGALVEAGDKNLLVRPPNKTDSTQPALTVTPVSDRVRVNGVEYKIVTMKEVNTTSTNALIYDLYIRR